jgi:hypothetical protein
MRSPVNIALFFNGFITCDSPPIVYNSTEQISKITAAS